MLASVPDQNSISCDWGRRTLRTMRGVIDRTISVFCFSFFGTENRRPMRGRLMKPGTPPALPRPRPG
jgi:hypothetical protein